MMKRLRFLLAGLSFLVITGHAIAQAIPETNASSDKGTNAYVLAPNDVIQVRVYQEDDLETKARIAKDGTITMPLLGVLTIGGKSVEQAAKLIKDSLAQGYLVNPQVTMVILEYSKRRFTVLGQVQKPGSYEIPNEETIDLVQAIAMAGGYTRIGSPSKITLQRKLADEIKVFKLDAEAMAKNKDAKPFEVLPEDTITVGEKFL